MPERKRTLTSRSDNIKAPSAVLYAIFGLERTLRALDPARFDDYAANLAGYAWGIKLRGLTDRLEAYADEQREEGKG